MLKPLDFVRVRPEYFESNPEVSIRLPLGQPVFVSPDQEKQERDDKRNNIGLVTETNGTAASVDWLVEGTGLKNAWWVESDLEVINNLPALLSNRLAHPFGGNTNQGDQYRER